MFTRSTARRLWILAAGVAALGAVPDAPRVAGSQEKDAWMEQRERMVDLQIVRRGIEDARVIAALRQVPRHRFVPDSEQAWAYDDHPLPIGHDQTISQPYVVALMTEAIRPRSTDRVLEIGTGSGYQAAVLSLLVGDVYSIEIVEPLGRDAAQRLENLGYANVHVRIGDGYRGWPEEAPFDAIVVTAAPAEIPQALVDQLAEDGRMVVPVGTDYQELLVVTKSEGKVSKRVLTPVRFVPMVKGKPESGPDSR